MQLWKRGLLPVLCGATFIALAATPAIDPKLYIETVKYLASPELRGRNIGSPELEKAADYLERDFKKFGIKPIPGKSYYQPFPVTTEAQLGRKNLLSVSENGIPVSLRVKDDYLPMHFSSSGKMAGGVVFAGYGITAPDLGYDDYAGIDVKGKLVLILRHEPQEADEKSKFAGKDLTPHAQIPSKASNAKMHGAAGVVLVNDTPNHKGEPDELEKFGATGGPTDAGIPFIQVKSDAVAPWFSAAGKTMSGVVADIDKELKPETFAFPASVHVDANIEILRLVKTVRNIAAYIPGTTDEYVILGAHYDHLGLGGSHSLAPSMTGTVHPGADDNASGTAGVIELARWYAKQPKQKRGILFLSFTGEEAGLLGSAYYASNPELPIEKAVAMINMDMIGRIREGKVYVGGAATGTGLRALLEKVTPKHDMKVDFSEGTESGSSDHVSFIAKKVPSLFFFSGLHSDYHKPSDTWDKIDGPAAAKLLGMVIEITDELLAASGRPEFNRPAPTREGPVTTSASGAASGSGYGAWFGSVPDFGEGIKGVKFADVSPGSPAAKAGLLTGDIMTEFAGAPVGNLYDFTYALRTHKPGEEIKVKVIRNGKEMVVTVLLARRQ
jgi:hypothetical protein